MNHRLPAGSQTSAASAPANAHTGAPASNWGRWGQDDERGAANFITQDGVRDAARLARSGRVYSLSLPVQSSQVPVLPRRAPVQHFMTLDGGDYAAGLSRAGGWQTSDDYLALPVHGTTHIDALSHVWYDDQLYNGFPGSSVRSTGAQRCGIEKLRHLVGRGVLLDLCAHQGVASLAGGQVITSADLESCAQAQGVALREGDIMLFRTGWRKTFVEQGNAAFFKQEPGIGKQAAEWIGQRHFAGIGSDNYGIEVIPVEGDRPGPVHRRLIRDFGVYLLELLDLDQLAHDRVYEFLFVAAPLMITGGVGSPLNPLAIA